MAELTTLEEQLAELIGLAHAARETIEEVESLVDDENAASSLRQMHEEAEETERLCIELADGRNGKRNAILEKAHEAKGEATDMMSAYLDGDPDDLEDFELPTVAEGGHAVPLEASSVTAKQSREFQGRNKARDSRG